MPMIAMHDPNALPSPPPRSVIWYNLGQAFVGKAECILKASPPSQETSRSQLQNAAASQYPVGTTKRPCVPDY